MSATAASPDRRMSLWRTLADELDRWRGVGRVATLWWRDDDATAPTPELDRLLAHARRVPVALSVIPSLATIELARRLRHEPSVTVLQHGWAHASHAPAGRSEYPPSRSIEAVTEEVRAGRARLLERFGDQVLAVFVPPWHSFDDRFLPLLGANGITHISRRGPRLHPHAADGLLQVNAHVALSRATRPSFTEEEWCVAAAIDHLRGRRTGRYEPTEPTGLLTHHHLHGEDSYAWIARLIDVTLQHSARWLNGRDVFAAEHAST